jgi:hypothetical protein
MNRREALSRLTGFIVVAALRPAGFRPHTDKPFEHPDPRPGITGDHVLAEADLPAKKAVRQAYANARAFPELFDGVYCMCDCRETLKHRSLLSCFESKQPTGCMACQEEAELIAQLAKDGKSLQDIRAAIDKKWG